MVDQNFVIQENNVIVAGGRETLRVDTSFGPSGTRGGLILYGSGKPDSPSVSLTYTPQLLDWYINLDVTDDEYLFLYQYVSTPESERGISWRRVFKIIPNEYSTNVEVTFINGQATANINVTNTSISLLGITALSQLNTHIDITTTAGMPIASTFKVLGYDINENTGEYVVPINLYAAQLNPIAGWEAVSGKAIANITINVI